MFELQYVKKHHQFIIASDEVGRGPLAGPVVSAAIKLQFKDEIELIKISDVLRSLRVNDSKKISSKVRQEIILSLLQGNLKEEANHKQKIKHIHENLKLHKVIPLKLNMQLTLSSVSSEIIDRINILQASLQSMENCVENFFRHMSASEQKSTLILIDGHKNLKNFEKSGECFPIVKGDQRSPFIGLASLFAKEYRDQLMLKLSRLEPYKAYELDKHFGYPTLLHREKIKEFGWSDIHRKTFKGVKEYVQSEKGENSG